LSISPQKKQLAKKPIDFEFDIFIHVRRLTSVCTVPQWALWQLNIPLVIDNLHPRTDHEVLPFVFAQYVMKETQTVQHNFILAIVKAATCFDYVKQSSSGSVYRNCRKESYISVALHMVVKCNGQGFA
jgi:hypothetical protein